MRDHLSEEEAETWRLRPDFISNERLQDFARP